MLTVLYGISVTAIVLLILTDKIRIKINLNKDYLFLISLCFSLLFFLLQFPTIIPFHRNTKPVAEYYKSLPYPGEAVLFYSDAGNVEKLVDSHPQIYSSCKRNYLITPEAYENAQLLIQKGSIRLYKL